ncbi:MAG: VPLPA-CTERM sorting domain-containing protein [Pseudomonadota bacterium]
MTLRTIGFAALAAFATVGAANATSVSPITGNFLTGVFNVTVSNFNAHGHASNAAATQANIDAADVLDNFVYSGPLNFAVPNPTDEDLESIGDFFATASGTVSGLDTDIANLRLSTPHFQTTTILTFERVINQSFDVTAQHDDGIAIFDDGSEILAYTNPTGVRTTGPGAFDGGTFRVIYAAANGNPSVLRVTTANIAPVPLPAPAALLGMGVLGLGLLRRKSA